MKQIKLLCEVRSAIAIQIEAENFDQASEIAFKMGLLALKEIEETETPTPEEEHHEIH